MSRGQRAVMACNISNPLLSVAIYRSAHGEAFEPVFSVRPPGCFCRGGWQLQVRGGVARLVIEDANHTQAGCYKWYLQGLQRNIEVTTLNVSGEGRRLHAPAPPQALSYVGGAGGAILCPPEVPRAPGLGPREGRPGFQQSRVKQDRPLLLQGPAPQGGPVWGAALSREEARPVHLSATHQLWGWVPPAMPVLPEALAELGLPPKVPPSCTHPEVP